MKKIILLLVGAILSTSLFAQITFGGQVGANFGIGQTGGGLFPSPTNDPKIGFVIGALADLPIVEKISFRPEFNFIQKGNQYGYSTNLGATINKTKNTLNYLELPLNVVYKMAVGKSSNKLYFGLGPAIGIGIIGNAKTGSNKSDIKFNGNPDQLKRLDVGLNLLAGYQFDMGLFGKIGYTHGFSNIDPDKLRDESFRNRGVSLCVGFMIGSGGIKK